MKKSRWLVTGAGGFLGANAGAFLRTHNVEAIGLARAGHATHFDATVHADLDTPGHARSVIETASPDVILHCAALSSHQTCELHPDQAHRVNSAATGEIAEAAADIGAHFIYISTDSVFDGLRGNYSETDATHPVSVYGQTKLEGEELASSVTNPLIIRTNFFGWSPTGERSILEFFYHNLKGGNAVPGFTNVTTTSLYVPTLLDYIWQLQQARQSGVFHVTSHDALSKFEFGHLVATTFGFDPKLVHPALSPEPKDISLNTAKLANFLGQLPESQSAGIAFAVTQVPGSC